MCGIVGIVNAGGVSFPLYYALFALQHRGQESAGISTYERGLIHKHKGKGLVAEIFNEAVLSDLGGTCGVGHVRYPTTGEKIPENIQPFNFTFQNRQISIAHNGNLVNTEDLRRQYEERGQIFCTTTDTEIIGNIIADELRRSGSVLDAVLLCMRRLSGSYSVVMMVDGVLYGFRDPLGNRPLCFGRIDDGYIIASESVAIDSLGGTFIRDVHPGELIRIDEKGIECTRVAAADRCAHCIFEYVYFARADSVIDGRQVYGVRRRIGHHLHSEAPVAADIVSPVPDSGIAHAIGYSEASGIPYREGLMKNRYIGRTFIMPTQESRESAVRMKLNPVRDHIRDRSIVLVDDSIVRGTTSRRIINIIRGAGAREVHVRIGSPPIKTPCYLGVDMPTREELIASDKENEAVCKSIGATTLHHVSLRALLDAIGINDEDLCTGCLTGVYPVSVPGEKCAPRHVTFLDGTYQTDLGRFEGEE